MYVSYIIKSKNLLFAAYVNQTSLPYDITQNRFSSGLKKLHEWSHPKY